MSFCAKPMARSSASCLAGRSFSLSKPAPSPRSPSPSRNSPEFWCRAIATSNYLIAPIHLGSSYAISLSTQQLIAVAMILLLTWSNTRGLKLGKLIQNTFTFAKTAALIGLIVSGSRSVERDVRRAQCCLVGFLGERLEAASRAARSRGHRGLRARDVVRQSDGRSALCAIGLE